MVSVQFRKYFARSSFCVGWAKKDISFHSDFQNVVLANLLLSSCACYQVDLDDVHEETTLTARNFNNNWLIYLHFSDTINLCPNIWFNKNSNCQQFCLTKEPPKKTNFSIFLKACYLVMGGSIDMNVAIFWETSVGFLKSVVLQVFPK